MELLPVRLCVLMDLLVVLFQVFGVFALLLCRFHVGPRWAVWGRVGFVVALIGLGLAGALCSRQGSDFGLFAGLSMTTLLIGMTIGGGPATDDEVALRMAAEGQASQ